MPDPKIGYIERPLCRHSSGMGSVLEFSDTALRKILVLDSKYRDIKTWGTYGVSVEQLMRGDKPRNKWYSITNKFRIVNMNLHRMTDESLNEMFANFIDPHTAKQNCNMWMRLHQYTDELGTMGVPAVEYAREQLVDGVSCDIPNLQTLMRIQLEADRIDALDPTAKDNITKTLGLMNPTQHWGCMTPLIACSSSEQSNYGICCIDTDGNCYYAYKTCDYLVVPIQEL